MSAIAQVKIPPEPWLVVHGIRPGPNLALNRTPRRRRVSAIRSTSVSLVRWTPDNG
jgi:hypothetical protein